MGSMGPSDFWSANTNPVKPATTIANSVIALVEPGSTAAEYYKPWLDSGSHGCPTRGQAVGNGGAPELEVASGGE